MSKETNIDCMKYRKSTHLAGVDVEAIVAEKGNCILTIKEAFYNTNVDVSGNKTNGYFLEFQEDVKPMVVNSGNRKNIALMLKNQTNSTSLESRNIGKWAGLKIELIFDPTVKMMGAVVGGIKVTQPIKKIISDILAIEALTMCNSLEALSVAWNILTAEEKNLPTVLALKEKLKISLK